MKKHVDNFLYLEAKRGLNNIEKPEKEVPFSFLFFPFVFFLKKNEKKGNTFNNFSGNALLKGKWKVFFFSLAVHSFVFCKISFLKPKRLPPRKKKFTNLTGVAKNQNVAKTQKKQTSERKQKNGHTKKSFLFSTQALKGEIVVFFCSTRFFKKKKRRQKKGKGLLLFLALRPWQNLFKMSAAFFAFLIIPLF